MPIAAAPGYAVMRNAEGFLPKSDMLEVPVEDIEWQIPAMLIGMNATRKGYARSGTGTIPVVVEMAASLAGWLLKYIIESCHEHV